MRGNQGTLSLDAALLRIAAHQLGLVTSQQAAAAGIDRSALARRRAAGLLVPVFAGVDRVRSADCDARQRCLAAALAVRDSSVGGPSAGLVHEFPLPQAFAQTETAPLVCVGRSRRARVPGITVVRHSVLLPRQKWFGAWVATPAAAWVMLPRYRAGALS
jgi:hypothetical protein